MNYGSEIETPTQQINNIILAAVPSPNYQGTLQNIVPFDQQREQTISHLTREYDAHTQEMVQTKEQTDLVNEAGRYLKDVQGKNTTIKTKLESDKKVLDEKKKELQLQLSKQKIVFDLLLVFGATITVYLLFRSFSFVHGLALGVLVIGILYVLQYNAYRIRLFGTDDSSKIHLFSGSNFLPSSWTASK